MPRLPALLLAAVTAALPITSRAGVCCRPTKATPLWMQKKQVVPNPVGVDTNTVIDVKSYPLKIRTAFEGERRWPAWCDLDQLRLKLGIVMSASKADAGTKTSGISPDDIVAVFDLTSNQP